MTPHLTDEERLDALEGGLSPSRVSHVEGCPDCRDALADLTRVYARLTESKTDDAADPSPLFWEHFPQRVSTAVAATETAAVPWWRGSPRAWLALATAAAVLVTAVLLPRTSPRGAPAGGEAGTPAASIAGGSDADALHWQFVVDVLGAAGDDAVDRWLQPASGTVDAAFESLTPAEREAFVRLLEADLVGSE